MKVKELIEKLKRFQPEDDVKIGRTHDGELILAVCRPVEWRNGRKIMIGTVRLEEEELLREK
ncbi:MAG: hypothetical protein DRJ18_00065 [Candidatus Methanomethylicota archaeon]|nr:MAG: hypothetical protein DRJ18_00065 [Candidatus Verstraetearchaeota archaeon]